MRTAAFKKAVMEELKKLYTQRGKIDGEIRVREIELAEREAALTKEIN